MVGGGGVQIAGLKTVPQRLLVALGTEGRAHHITCGGLPVGVLIHAVVEQQVPGQHFAVHRLALAAGIGDFVQRFTGRDVHQVQRRANGLRDANGPAGGFALNLRRPRQRVGFRAGDALCQQLALQVIHQLAVFRVHGGHRAQFQAAFKACDQSVIGGHDRVFVGHEMFETVDAVVAHQLGHFFADLFAPPRDGDMETVVRRRLLSPAAPLVKGLQQRLLRVGNDKVNNRRCPACQTCCRTTEKVFTGNSAHKR